MTENAMDTHASQGPHVLPISTYFKVWAALLAFTGLTIGASYVNIGRWNLPLAIAIATAKACMVALVFMHLWWDRKFHAFVFLSSIVFLGIFIAFTMFDTTARGRADALERERPADLEQPFAATQREAELKQHPLHEP